MKKTIRKPQGKRANLNHGLTDTSPASVVDSVRLPEPWCWVAEAWVDAEGHEASSQVPGAVGVFAVSVHEQYPTNEHQRLLLLQEVPQRLGSRVPQGHDSLWVYPGGYFGFDASSFAWPGFDAHAVRAGLARVLRAYPSRARLALGADGEPQQVWVCWLEANGSLQVQVITRHRCDLPERRIMVGSMRAAFFVCGEFTGSYTEANGPYCGNHYLSDPATQLEDCRLLVDLAHSRVKGSVYRAPGPRQVHQRQMLRFAPQGTSVLTHHHPGGQTAGRARNDCQSNWVIFRGGRRLDDGRVHSIP
jgi:hypothetical protein